MRATDRSRTALWRTDGARLERVDVRALPDGGLEIMRHEMGASDDAAWGGDDHEATLELSPSAVAQLAQALMSQCYGGRADAFEALRELCAINAIEARYAVWT